jgi:hypothetical protein
LWENKNIQCHYHDSELEIHKAFAKENYQEIIAISEESVLEFTKNVFKVLGTKKIIIFDHFGENTILK